MEWVPDKPRKRRPLTALMSLRWIVMCWNDQTQKECLWALALLTRERYVGDYFNSLSLWIEKIRRLPQRSQADVLNLGGKESLRTSCSLLIQNLFNPAS